MKKLIFRAAVISAVGALFRVLLIVLWTERGSGFLVRGKGPAAPLLLGSLILCVAVLCRPLRRLARHTPPDSGLLVGLPGLATGAALLAAAMLAFSAVLALREEFRLASAYAVTAVPAVFGLLALIPSACGKRARPGAESVLALLPVVWGMVAMLCSHVANNTIVTVPENAFTVVGMAVLLVALYTEAKLRGLQHPTSYLPMLLTAAVLLTATVVPQMLLRLWMAAWAAGGGLFVSHCVALDLAMTGFVPLLWVRLLTAAARLTRLKQAPSAALHAAVAAPVRSDG